MCLTTSDSLLRPYNEQLVNIKIPVVFVWLNRVKNEICLRLYTHLVSSCLSLL